MTYGYRKISVTEKIAATLIAIGLAAMLLGLLSMIVTGTLIVFAFGIAVALSGFVIGCVHLIKEIWAP